MSARISKGYQVEIASAGFGVTKIFAETLEALDVAVDRHFASLEAVRESRGRAKLARLAGFERKSYKVAREALEGGE